MTVHYILFRCIYSCVIIYDNTAVYSRTIADQCSLRVAELGSKPMLYNYTNAVRFETNTARILYIPIYNMYLRPENRLAPHHKQLHCSREHIIYDTPIYTIYILPNVCTTIWYKKTARMQKKKSIIILRRRLL